MKFQFKYTFQGRNYVSNIEANTQYAAQIKFNEFILSKIKIESIEEEQPKQDPSVEFLKGVFGMKNVLLLCVLSFASCRRDLAKECAKRFPCTVSKEVVTKIEVKTDTILKWQELPPLPLVGIRCFQWENEKSIEIFKVPCAAVNEQKTVYLTSYILDTAKITALSYQVLQLQKDSAKIAQKLVDSKNNYIKYGTFWKYGFLWTWLVIILLAAFAIYRKTKKV